MDIKENDGKFKNTGFRPLIWGFFFYKNNIFFYEDLKGEFPSPHSGILFLSAFDGEVVISPYFSFRPLIRGFFFYGQTRRYTLDNLRRDVSVPLFGDSCFIREMKLSPQCGEIEFPSPYSGILFLSPYGNGVKLEAVGQGFRPLIRGFFFYGCNPPNIQREIRRRFRPLIRGFFFYLCRKQANYDGRGHPFPSPYSGILFLLKAAKNKSLGRRTCFRPLIRGFFFYDSLRPPDIPQYQGFRPLIRGFFFYAYMV